MLSHRTRMILAMFWDSHEDFDAFARRVFDMYGREILALTASKIRIPMDLYRSESDVLSKRAEIIGLEYLENYNVDVMVDKITSLLEGSYVGAETPNRVVVEGVPYRDWHVVTHGTLKFHDGSQGENESALKRSGVRWMLSVKAQGRQRHMHAVLSFVRGRPADFVLDFLGLSSDATASLEPIHHSRSRAREYILSQAIEKREYFSMPEGEIWAHANSLQLTQSRARYARIDGEDPYHTTIKTKSGTLIKGYNRDYVDYLDVQRAQGFFFKRVVMKDEEDVAAAAAEASRAFNARWFMVDYGLLIAPFLMNTPEGYNGEAVVVLKNVPRRFKGVFRAEWLANVPLIMYTVSKDA